MGIESNIELAHRLRELILREQKLSEKVIPLINHLRDVLSSLKRESTEIGMVSICAKCAEEGKCCCGSEIEYKYSPQLLAINLLLQVSIPKKPEIEGMCYFLTSKGCCLLARDVFCLNYICERIRDRLTPEMLTRLRELEGEALRLQFELEKSLGGLKRNL